MGLDLPQPASFLRKPPLLQAALLDKFHGLRHCPFGIGSITHIIAKQHIAISTQLLRVLQASAERLAVRVHVCKQGNQHLVSP